MPFNFPWVIGTLIQEAAEGRELSELAVGAESGSFGDLADWVAAESRLAENGILPRDLKTWSNGSYLNNKIGEIGAPYFGIISRSEGAERDEGSVLDLVRALQSVPFPAKRYRALEALLFGIGARDNVEGTWEIIDLIVDTALSLPQEIQDRTAIFLARCPRTWKHPGAVALIDSQGQRSTDKVRSYYDEDLTGVVKAFNSDTSLRGLIPHIAALAGRRKEPIGELVNLQAFTVLDADSNSVRSAATYLGLIAKPLGSAKLADLASNLACCGWLWVSQWMKHLRGSRRALLVEERRLLLHIMESFSANSSSEFMESAELIEASLNAEHSALSSSSERGRLALPTGSFE